MNETTPKGWLTKSDVENAVYIRDAGPDWGTVHPTFGGKWMATVKLERKRKMYEVKDTREQAQQFVDILMDGI